MPRHPSYHIRFNHQQLRQDLRGRHSGRNDTIFRSVRKGIYGYSTPEIYPTVERLQVWRFHNASPTSFFCSSFMGSYFLILFRSSESPHALGNTGLSFVFLFIKLWVNGLVRALIPVSIYSALLSPTPLRSTCVQRVCFFKPLWSKEKQWPWRPKITEWIDPKKLTISPVSGHRNNRSLSMPILSNIEVLIFP